MECSGKKKGFFFSFVAMVQVAALLVSTVALPVTARAQTSIALPNPGTMVRPSETYAPVILRGVKVDVNNPLLFDFIVDKGDSGLAEQDLEDEGQKLIKYFLTALTVPEDELWVNLSPYEGNRIIPEAFGLTEMGRDLLAQDYILKQLTASLSDPETHLGAEFWQRVYERAQAEFGTTDIPVNTFNKVWIMPDKAKVVERGNTVYIVENKLKVMTEQDYLSLENNKADESLGTDRVSDEEVSKASKVSAEIVREIILPELAREVNEGKNFANLRQVYNSLLLSAWYKRKVKESILSSTFLDQNKVAGDELADKTEKEQIYQKYVEAFRLGAYNFIKEDVNRLTNEVLPRKYFSGGAIGRYDFAQVENVTLSAAGSLGTDRIVDMRASVRTTGGTDRTMRTARDIMLEFAKGVPTIEMIDDLPRVYPSLDQKQRKQVFTDLRSSILLRANATVTKRANTALKDLVDIEARQRPQTLLSEAPGGDSWGTVTSAYEHWKSVSTLGEGFYFRILKGPGEVFGVGISNEEKDGKKVVYIEESLLQGGTDDQSRARVWERLLAAMAEALTPRPHEGLITYWHDVKKRKRGIGGLAQLFRFDARIDPDNLIDGIDSMFDQAGYARILKQNGIEVPELTSARDFLLETERYSRWTAAELIRGLVRGQISNERVQPFLAFAGSPTTSAHILSILGAIVLTQNPTGIFNLTGDDYRKVILTINKMERLQLNQNIAKKIPVLFVPTNFRDLNGEERIDQEAFDEVSGGVVRAFMYLFGFDHYSAFEIKGGKVVWKSIRLEENAVDFWYYYRRPEIRNLLQALMERPKEYGLSAADVEAIGRIITALDEYWKASPLTGKHYKELTQVQRQIDVALFFNTLHKVSILQLPPLDVVGKQWLNNLNLYGTKPWQIALGVLPRGPMVKDPIRDMLIDGTFSVGGKAVGQPMAVSFLTMPEMISQKVSSTDARKLLIDLVFDKKASVNRVPALVTIPLTAWEFIFSNETYLLSLFHNEKTPVAVGPVRQFGSLQAAVTKLNEEIVKVAPQARAEIYEGDNEDRYLRIFSNGNQVDITIRNLYTDAGWKNMIISEMGNFEGDLPQPLQEAVQKFNQVDAAMKMSPQQVADIQGGIDFSLNDIGLEVQADGPEIQFNINPELLKGGNFEGLVPVILGVTPITSLPVFLGAESGAGPEKPLAFNTVDELLAIMDQEEIAV